MKAEPPASPGLVLFVADDAPASRRARTVVREAILSAGLEETILEVVDVYTQPRRALQAACVATPSLLMGDGDGATYWYVGDFSADAEVAAFIRALEGSERR